MSCKEVDAIGLKLAIAPSDEVLDGLASHINKAKQSGAFWTRDVDEMKLLRRLYSDRKQELSRRAVCRPHNNPDNYIDRGNKVYCKQCGEYIGRRRTDRNQDVRIPSESH